MSDLSTLAESMIGSEILRIAYQVRDKIEGGADVLNLTVGDFNPAEFPIPDALRDGIADAIQSGQSNYPPSNGVKECREAVQGMFARRLGLEYDLDAILIAGGARPMIAGTYLALVDRGEKVVYGLPSWNNNHYAKLVGAEAVEVGTDPAAGFFPRASDLKPHIESARLICLNTPMNPTGTVMEKAELTAICNMIVEENQRRAGKDGRLLYLMFDQVYWMLTFGETAHHTPPGLVPAMKDYTLFVDGISKGFASTGLRVGWCAGPKPILKKMNALLTHLGAWAPRPEQVATAKLLNDDGAVDEYLVAMGKRVLGRLELLSRGVASLREKGHPVEAIAPQGAIYLSMKIDIRGKKTADGKTIETDEDIRQYLLDEAGLALIPFSCFGLKEDTAWFRASVGSVSMAHCESITPRLEGALDKLS